MSPAFWLTRYVIWTTRQAKRELCRNERHHWSPTQDSPLYDQASGLGTVLSICRSIIDVKWAPE